MRTIPEMIAVIQIYIHHRKDKEVSIMITDATCIPKIITAYNIAINWLQNNGFKQF